MKTAPARYSVGIEEGADGTFLVHGLTLPGSVAGGTTADIALDAYSVALTEWLTFLEADGQSVPPTGSEIDMTVDEWLRTNARTSRGDSRVCFDADRRALSDEELYAGLKTLGALRGRILPQIRRARDEDLAAMGTTDWNARIVLDELARASWWTLTRLGSSPLAEVPERVVGRLDTAMALVVQRLGNLDPWARGKVILLEGEEWTPRKVLRRLLWLEWDLGGAALDAFTLPPARAS